MENIKLTFQQVKATDGSLLMTSDQVDKLLKIRLTRDEFLINVENRYFIYEVYNMIRKLGYYQTYEYLNQDWSKIYGNVADIRKKIVLGSPLMKPFEDKLNLDMEIYRNKIDVGKGAIDCVKCGSENTVSVEKQMRSADEPMSVIVTCMSCSYKWFAQ